MKKMPREGLLFFLIFIGICVTYYAQGFEPAALMLLTMIAWYLLEIKWRLEQKE